MAISAVWRIGDHKSGRLRWLACTFHDFSPRSCQGVLFFFSYSIISFILLQRRFRGGAEYIGTGMLNNPLVERLAYPYQYAAEPHSIVFFAVYTSVFVHSASTAFCVFVPWSSAPPITVGDDHHPSRHFRWPVLRLRRKRLPIPSMRYAPPLNTRT